LELSFDYFPATDGDVLVVTIHRRRGMPSAVIERSGAEIRRRTYYIRSGSRKKLVDDTTLEFMFKHIEDPNTTATYHIPIWYKREDFILSPVHFPNFASFMLPYIQNIQRKKEASYLFEDEGNRMRALFLEVLPYTFLNHAGLKLGHSWLTRVVKFGSGAEYTPVRTDLPSDNISSRDLPIDGVKVLPKLSIDMQKVLEDFHFELKLPKGTKVEIRINNEDPIQGTSSVKFKNPLFEFNITFSPSVWSVGLPYPLTNKLFMEDTEIQDLFATTYFRVSVEAKFSFPDIPDPMFELHYAFVQSLMDLLDSDWNWNKELERVKDGRIDMIQNTVKDILLLVRRKAKLKSSSKRLTKRRKPQSKKQVRRSASP
jgi:hypothetical protein